MKLIVETGDTFMGQKILLEVDSEGGDIERLIALARKRWKDWVKDATRDTVLQVGAEMPKPVHPDTVRLDWLTEQGAGAARGGRDFAQLVKIHGEWRVEGSVFEGRGKTAREAIDDAMANENADAEAERSRREAEDEA